MVYYMLYISGPNSSLSLTGGKKEMGRADGENSRGAQTWIIIAVLMAFVPGALVQERWHETPATCKDGL